MIFKRKEARPVGVGEFVEINNEVIQKMINLDSYQKNSVCNHFRLRGRNRMYRSEFRKSKNRPSEIMAADVRLFYTKESIFKNNLMELVPLCVSLDTKGASGVIKLIEDKKTFFIDKSCLAKATNTKVKELIDDYSDPARNWIKKAMSVCFNINNFSWEGK